MSFNLDDMSVEDLEKLEREMSGGEEGGPDLDNMSLEDLQKLEGDLSAEPEKKKPTSAERKLAQAPVSAAAGARSLPRLLLETPGFLADVSDIAARKIQQPFKKAAIDTPEREAAQDMFPGVDMQNLLKPRKDEFAQPGSFLRNLIPEKFQEGYQGLKESQIGDFKLFPGYEESREEIVDQLARPGSALDKLDEMTNLGDLFLNEEEIKKKNENRRPESEIRDILTPQDTWEKYQDKVIGMGTPTAISGGAAGLAGGAAAGAVDQAMDDAGFDEDDRKLVSFMAAMAAHRAASTKGGGGVLEDAVEGAEEGPGGPGGPDIPTEPFILEVVNDIDSPDIGSGMQLAAKLLGPRMHNVNMKQLEIANAEGINPTLYSVTDGGALQYGQNTLSQNFLTKKYFDSAAKRMTGEIQDAIETKIDNMSPGEFLDLSQVPESELGTIPFENPVKTLTDSFSDDALTVYETGERVQDRLIDIKSDMKEANDQIWDDLKSAPEMDNQFHPMTAGLKVKSLLGDVKMRGLRSEQRSKLQNQLKTLESFFYTKQTGKGRAMKTVPREISIRELMNQAQDLGATIDFDKDIGNLSKMLNPIREALIDDIEGAMERSGNPDLLDKWQEAKGAYREYAETFGRKNKTVYKAINADKPETIVSSSKDRSGLQSILKAFEKTGRREKAYFNLQKKIVEEIAGPNALVAESLKDFKINAKSINKLNEIKPLLQMDAQLLIDEIADVHSKKQKGISNELKMDAMRADILNSLAKGSLPENTLQAMNNIQNIRMLKETLSGTETGRKFLDALKKQKVREIIFNKAIDANEKVTLSKVNQNLKDPSNIAKLKELMPGESIEQLQNISRFVDKAIEGDQSFRNFSQTATAQQNAAMIQKMYSMAKNLGGALVGGGLSWQILGALKTLAPLGAMMALSKLYTTPRFMRAFTDMTLKARAKQTPSNARAYEASVKNMLGVMKEELTPEQFEEVNKLND